MCGIKCYEYRNIHNTLTLLKNCRNLIIERLKHACIKFIFHKTNCLIAVLIEISYIEEIEFQQKYGFNQKIGYFLSVF